MFHIARTQDTPTAFGDMVGLLEQVAQVSTRPRYAFMMLSLIAQVARSDGSAGPFVGRGNHQIALRDWLCDALIPMGARDPKRHALAERVRQELARAGQLPGEAGEARAIVDREVFDRVRASGKTNLSRAVSELVRAGLIRRHYQGYRVDHHNRGGHRHVVYTLTGQALCLLADPPRSAAGDARQGELWSH